jgi:ATP synthase protein I
MRGFAAARNVESVGSATMLSRLASRPIRTVLRWQFYATAALALIFGFFSGLHGALSATFGGFATIVPGVLFGLMGSLAQSQLARGQPAQLAVLGMLRAEAVKIGLTILLLWLVLKLYHSVVVLDLIVTFVTCTLIFSMAAFVRD